MGHLPDHAEQRDTKPERKGSLKLVVVTSTFIL